MRVTIMGSGVQGLVSALCCAHAGLGEVLFLDTHAPAIAPVIELPPNATRVLNALGLHDALMQIAYTPMSELFRSGSTGYVLAHRPLGPFVESRYGAAHLHCSTASLTHLLQEASTGAGVEFASRDSQSTGDADVLLIACQSEFSERSMVDEHITSSSSNWQIGYSWQGDTGGPLLNWFDAGCYARQIPVRDGTCTMLLRDTTTSSMRIERLLTSNAAIEWHPVAEQTQPTSWYRDHRALIGDAAHPLLPFGGQDFALAVEDAWVLSRMLDTFDDHVSTALSEYQRYRQPRVRQMQTHLANQAIQHGERKPLRRLANSWSLALKYRLMPEIAMQRDDWQFEYDCIRGFH